MTALSQCRVVLIRPRIAANLGAVARVMRNFGVRDLALVQPEADVDDPRGRLLATHAQDILDTALIVDNLSTAVADCRMVLATSARVGGLFRRQSVATPRQIMPELVDVLSQGPAALVFGPESSGLTDEEITQCHYLLQIETDREHPALNLAQAVAICLYELRVAATAASVSASAKREAASFGDQEHMFAQLRTALEKIHYLYGPKADALMHALRHLLGRAQLSPQEVDILRGLARQIRWCVDKQQSSDAGSPVEHARQDTK